MRISFICGSLASGMDGVGDYTRCLARACVEAGHECLLISINDCERASEIDGSLQIERYKSALHDTQAVADIFNRIRSWQPTWISLQFVPFAFHSRGLIKQLLPFISRLREEAALEVMFHELWLGEKPSLSFKHKILGWVQKKQLLQALRIWSPDCIHTSNTLYQNILARHGHSARRLPLFGNIAITPPTSDTLKELLEWYPPKANERVILFPFSQSTEWDVQRSLDFLKKVSDAASVSLRLIQVGKNTSGQEHWRRIPELAQRHGWSCDILGARSQEVLSQLMHFSDLGVSASNIQLADKSGAIVAMLEHGLPVLCTTQERESKHPVMQTKTDRLFDLSNSSEAVIDLLKKDLKPTAESRLQKVAKQWLADLGEITRGG
jgi:hypothetical protein